MNSDFIYLSSPGINDFVKQFPSEMNQEEKIKFPNVGVGKFGALLQDYYSFVGFYKIKNQSGNTIKLEKLEKLSTKEIPKVYSILNLEFNHTSFLQIYANVGVSFLKGKFNSKDVEGTIKKSGLDYQILITNLG